MLRELKVGNDIHLNVEVKTTDIDGNEKWNIPQELDKFKVLAIDTLMWRIGNLIQKASGGSLIDIVTAISKIQVEQMHLIKKLLTKEKIEEESKNAQLYIEKMEELYSKGYSDSEKALNTIVAVDTERDKLYHNIQKVQSATTHEEVIAILNED